LHRLTRANGNPHRSVAGGVGQSTIAQKLVRPTPTGNSPPQVEKFMGFTGMHPLVDEWFAAHRQDPMNFGTTRPIAVRIMRDTGARDILTEMLAQGIPEATKIDQQAKFHRQVMQSQQTSRQR
jgi:hypothetical protein